MLFVILEIGIVFFANYALENAAGQGARMLRTGKRKTKIRCPDVQGRGCKHITAPLDCGKLKLDVRRFTNFSNADLTQPLDAKGDLKTNFGYDPALAAMWWWYEHLSFGPARPAATRYQYGHMADGNRLVVATVAFRNEPFQVTSTTQ